ncbi:zinc finger BED domain-containing protein RICESLEEPER 2-like [Herrania umbratica]|uniref:Zinc finger BED domain-containing protein RICESLEEPER 2-like n=1 Tax=Herrania umbratica TaxID=108875 RepID=A0A6J1ASY0_9ROSI|nr:zinc finger BED domain-containing protein RICESLEEPER 2-like [Herrania umbratica]XP_021290109.1 zinc finger BED domain-containing protein RICESLEEPER 2-like [Herrania umbratica]XP_021290110.1 zinc finger BED domain-containing protein RICESLEEPER 2-like [Herrania umbratica]XP_021290111.1 zinc finger BED domain-containing protein RICESLEEPER 2-like [Herrania umbratica]
MDNFDQKLGPDFLKNLSGETISPLSVVIHEDIYESSSKRPKTTSKVWDVFEKLPAQQGDSKAICKLCRRIYTAKTTSGTSHLRRHIEACLKRGNHDLDQRSTEACFKPVNRDANRHTVSHGTLIDAATPLKSYKLDVDEIRHAIAMMIIVDAQPLRVVEDTGFRHVLNVACPEFPLLSRKAIKRDIISIYLKERENIRELLGACPGRICLTSSTWESNYDDRYNCVTAHFIDHEWRLQKRILRFKLIPPPYDRLSIADEIASCMVQWNIEHKVFSVTLENLSSDDCVPDMLKSRLDAKKYLPFKGAFFNMSCSTRILNLIVQAGFNLIIDIIGKLRLGIKYVQQSPHRKKNFYIIAKTLNLDTQKKLCLDSPSRWNSTYNMIEVALCYKNAFLYLAEQDKNFIHKLSEDEWEKVSVSYKFLKVIFEVACIFFRNIQPTSNLYFKALWKVHSRLSDMVRGPENFMTCMVKEMQSKFNQYWSEYNLILSCAAILDPRYKIKFVEYCYTKLYGSGAQQYVSASVNTLYGLFHEYMQNSACPSPTATLSVLTTKISNDKEDNDGFEDYETFQSARFQTQVEKSQLDLYLEEPSHDLNSEIDVLEYWTLCSLRYPELSRMARDVLTIPVSTIASDNVFDIGPQVISTDCSSLKSKMIQALVCLQDWMLASDKTRGSGSMESRTEDDSSSSSDGDDDY